ncbi:MAG: cation:proton antiporter [Bacteroides sp.]|nr:cation:proton antiporter [Bacteroidaceae bacterium]MBQ8770252.1 cation:proton antiporter [Bacteroides sp.]
MKLPDIGIHLPITDPTWIFFLVLMIILFAPIILGRLRIPHIIGMILAGVVIGKYGFNILERDSSFELFGKVGIYYIMFLAGLEMDLENLKKNLGRAFVFGLLTFAIPFAVGMWVGMSLFRFSVGASLLLSSIFASHTLVAYPIVGRYGLSRHASVSISIGGTMFALTVSLFVLAGISGIYKGELDSGSWMLFVLKCVAYCVFVFWIFPRFARWFFRKYEDNVMQYIFVLALVFLSAALAELAGMEGIFGAFLAGLVLNRLIPHVSPLMNRTEFVGNALFIPYFLIGVGMLINLGTLFSGGETLKVVLVMVVVATVTKWIAAWLTQKIYRMSKASRQMLFGLSNAHAAGALAMVMVGTKIEIAPGEYLMNEGMLNGVVIMILFSCIISSMVTEHAARTMALAEENGEMDMSRGKEDERMMVSIANPETVEPLVNMALLMRNPKSKKELLAVTVEVEYDEAKKQAKLAQRRKSLEHAARIASAVDVPMKTRCRLSTNAATGILNTASEMNATEIVLGLHHKHGLLDSFLGSFAQSILKGTHRQLMIVKCLMPVNTMRRLMVAVPPKAEYEAGFYKWVERLARIGGQLGCRVHFWAHPDTIQRISGYMEKFHSSVRVEFSTMDDWDDLLMMSSKVAYDHLTVIVSARKGAISYQPSFEELPNQITKYFSNSSLMLIYPDQLGDPLENFTFSSPRSQAENRIYDNVSKWVIKWVKKGEEQA